MSGETTRARLLSLLSEACELEHALCCSYLFAAFSIKRDLSEGLNWQQQQTCRLWASRIYHVAAQEMLHLAQAWNIITAVGGSPYYFRPNFPQAAKHFPLNVALLLRRFDVATMDRFIYYENPVHEIASDAPCPMPAGAAWPVDDAFGYDSVGELYGEIKRIILANNERDLFIGAREQQAGQPTVNFYDIVQVTNAETAVQGIDRITLQGEGTNEKREDSHFGVFNDIKRQLSAFGSVDPARPVADNPYVRRRLDQYILDNPDLTKRSELVITKVTNPFAELAMDLFDDVYVSMLQALEHLFTFTSADPKHTDFMSRSAIELMITVIKPLGEAICRLPSGVEGLNAGPAFALTRHTRLPSVPHVAARTYRDRLQQLADHAKLLTEEPAAITPQARAQILSAAANLKRIATME